MSYTIFKKIKVNTDGTIEYNSSDNNIVPHYFHDWKNDYFKAWQGYTPKTIENWIILVGLYGGDKYYMKSWQERQKMAWKFAKAYEGGSDKFFDDIHKEGYDKPTPRNLKMLADFMNYMEEHKQEKKNYKIQRLMDGVWAKNMTKAHIFYTPYFNEAKVFHCSEEELKEKLGWFGWLNNYKIMEVEA